MFDNEWVKENYKDFFPFLNWISKLKDPKILKLDIVAWITVAFILIPEAIAYAGLAWLPIEVWLFTAFVPVMIWALFSSSAQMSTWPSKMVSLMTMTFLAQMAIPWDANFIAYASMLAFFTWLFYILIWTLHFWVIVDFISHPVIIWFTNAVVLITIITQIPKVFWVHMDNTGVYYTDIYNMLVSIPKELDLTTFCFWAWGIIFLLLLKKYFHKLPEILILLIVSIIISYSIWYEGKIIKDIPSMLPNLYMPVFNSYSNILTFDQVTQLMLYAIIIWFIGFTETISVAKMVWYKTKTRVSVNREFVWQWLANLSSSFFGWYWVAWSFSKTAINMEAWAQTWFSSIVTWIVVAISILFLTPLLYYLPLATLAAIIIVAVLHLVKITSIIDAWKIEKHDGVVAIVTFLLTMIFAPNLAKWVIIWIIISLVLFIYRSMEPKVVEVLDIDLSLLKTYKNLDIIKFDWNVYFANAWYIEWKILKIISEKKDLKYLILDLTSMSNIDSSWMEVFEDLINELQSAKIEVYLSNVGPKIYEKFLKIWFFMRVSDLWLFKKREDAIDHIERKHWDKVSAEMI